MSAINEALKKAREQSPATSTGNSGFNLMPGEKPASTLHSLLGLPLILAAVLVVAGLVLLIHDISRSNPITFPQPEAAAPSSAPNATTPQELSPPASMESVVAAREPDPPAPEPDLAEATAATTPPLDAGSSVEIATYPSLRLQGIFYRQSRPSVIINSQTLEVGDLVEGVTVTDITPSSVTLQWRGQTKTLTLR